MGAVPCTRSPGLHRTITWIWHKGGRMRKTIFDPEARASLLARMERVPPDRAPRWGKMNAPRMLCHVSDALRSALGDLPARSKGKKLFTNPLVRWLMIYVVPWPK